MFRIIFINFIKPLFNSPSLNQPQKLTLALLDSLLSMIFIQTSFILAVQDNFKNTNQIINQKQISNQNAIVMASTFPLLLKQTKNIIVVLLICIFNLLFYASRKQPSIFEFVIDKVESIFKTKVLYHSLKDQNDLKTFRKRELKIKNNEKDDGIQRIHMKKRAKLIIFDQQSKINAFGYEKLVKKLKQQNQKNWISFLFFCSFFRAQKIFKAKKLCFKNLHNMIRERKMTTCKINHPNRLVPSLNKITQNYSCINGKRFCIIIIIIQYIIQKSLPMSDHIIFETSVLSDYHAKSQLASSDSKDRKDNSEIEFVSQFLELNGEQEPNQTLSKDKSADNEINFIVKSEIDQQELQNLQNSSEIKNKRSAYHNFQKHLITTLKISILVPKITAKSDLTSILASKMWKVFQKSNYFSKKILHFLFGVASSSRQQKKTEDINKIYPGFQEIAQTYEISSIERAQQFLRRQVYDQGKRLLSENVFSSRRMQKSEQFQQYFAKFLEEIQNGAISKRLPKYSKIRTFDNVTKIEEYSV